MKQGFFVIKQSKLEVPSGYVKIAMENDHL